MLNENTHKELSNFARNVVKFSRSNLTRQNKNSSKKLYNSMDFELNVSKNSFGLAFVMETYGIFQDVGVSGVKKKYNTPYTYRDKQPPAKAFDKWMVRKGIAPKDKEGKFISRKSLAFLIARSVFINGIKPSLFFTKPFEAAFKRLPDELIEKFGLDVDKFLEFTTKESLNVNV
jgi:hypothetical protein